MADTFTVSSTLFRHTDQARYTSIKKQFGIINDYEG